MKKTDLTPSTQDCDPSGGSKGDALHPVAVEIIYWLKRKQSLTAKKLAYETCTRRDTIKRHLRKLVADGIVRRHGRGKGTWYTL